MSDGRQTLRFGEFELDEANARLTRSGRPVPLPPKAFSVLCVLVRDPGRLIRKDALLDAVWGRRFVSESVLKTTVSQLRAALADDAGEPHYIETVSRHGYRFIGTLIRADASQRVEALPLAAATASIIGRTHALARLRSAWARALRGERQLVWVVGEAGVGKSTLIKRFASELPQDGLVAGHCVEHFGTGEPYLPLLEALRELCAREPQLPALMRAVAPTWIVQMPWLISEADRAGLHRDLAGAHPERMVREMRELLDRLTANRPLVLVLEDLHWSDLGTLRMMEHFARQPRSIRMLWIASFRLTQVIAEEHPLRELRQELRLHRLCDEIQLDPFSESEVNEYLESRLPAAGVDEDFVRRLHAHTEGLPLFVANVTDSLLAQGSSDIADYLHDAPNAPLPVPDNLSGVIEKQIERLSGDLQGVLAAASVCGVEFRAATVAGLIERDAQWVSQQCDDLARRRLWLRHVGIEELPDGGFDSRYAFLHALYQHVCYQRMPASQRVQYHRRVAAGIEGRRAAGEDIAAAELASHHERGHETMAALRAYGLAAQSALERFAPKDAEQLAAHGLSLLHRCADGPARMELELGLVRSAGVAAALLHGVASKEACAASERVRQLCDLLPQTPQRAAALTGLAWIAYVRGEFAGALALGKRMENIARQFDDALLFVSACNLTGVSLVALGEFTRGRQSLQVGIDRCQQMAAQMPPPAFIIDPEVSMRANLAMPLVDCGLVDQARSHLKQALARAARIGQPMAMMLAHWAGGMVHVRLNDPDQVAQHAIALAKVVEGAMLTQGEGPSLWLRGWAEAHRGEPRRGHDLITRGYECHTRLGMYAGCPEVLSYAVEALLLAGDCPAAQTQLEETLRLAERIGERLILASAHLLAARIALGRRDQAAARASLRESVRIAREQEALGLELKALVALAELNERDKADLAELDSVYRKVHEGFDTRSYVRAGELLTTLG